MRRPILSQQTKSLREVKISFESSVPLLTARVDDDMSCEVTREILCGMTCRGTC